MKTLFEILCYHTTADHKWLHLTVSFWGVDEIIIYDKLIKEHNLLVYSFYHFKGKWPFILTVSAQYKMLYSPFKCHFYLFPFKDCFKNDKYMIVFRIPLITNFSISIMWEDVHQVLTVIPIKHSLFSSDNINMC